MAAMLKVPARCRICKSGQFCANFLLGVLHMKPSMLCRRTQLGGTSGARTGRGSVEMLGRQEQPPAEASHTSADTATFLPRCQDSVASTDAIAEPVGSDAREGHLNPSAHNGLDTS